MAALSPKLPPIYVTLGESAEVVIPIKEGINPEHACKIVYDGPEDGDKSGPKLESATVKFSADWSAMRRSSEPKPQHIFTLVVDPKRLAPGMAASFDVYDFFDKYAEGFRKTNQARLDEVTALFARIKMEMTDFSIAETATLIEAETTTRVRRIARDPNVLISEPELIFSDGTREYPRSSMLFTKDLIGPGNLGNKWKYTHLQITLRSHGLGTRFIDWCTQSITEPRIKRELKITTDELDGAGARSVGASSVETRTYMFCFNVLHKDFDGTKPGTGKACEKDKVVQFTAEGMKARWEDRNHIFDSCRAVETTCLNQDREMSSIRVEITTGLPEIHVTTRFGQIVEGSSRAGKLRTSQNKKHYVIRLSGWDPENPISVNVCKVDGHTATQFPPSLKVNTYTRALFHPQRDPGSDAASVTTMVRSRLTASPTPSAVSRAATDVSGYVMVDAFSSEDEGGSSDVANLTELDPQAGSLYQATEE